MTAVQPASTPASPVVLDGRALTIADVARVARANHRAPVPVTISPAAADRIRASRAVVEQALAGGKAVYGLNTGFGSLSRVRVEHSRACDLQRNIIRSHAAGVGEHLPLEVSRALVLILAASLARGASGVRLETVERLVELLNLHVVPAIPSRGSVGASGDLAPLAHAALVLLGEGEAWINGRVEPAGYALVSIGMKPLALEEKEGLALLNGTHMMCAIGALLCHDFSNAFDAGIAAAAMAIDAAKATDAFLDPRIHEVRRQPGQIEVASRLRAMLAGSAILPSHAENDPRVQDPYSLRAAPQVMGAALDAFRFVESTVARELGAVTDNPLVFARDGGGGDIVSGGNFHGMPLAIALDVLAIACSHLAGISERRTYWVVSGFDQFLGLKPYLATDPGVDSGLMIVQYAAASCVNEIATLANPASVTNISTSAGIEDYNSFGSTSALKAMRCVSLARSVVAIELLVMAEALEAYRPLKSGAGVEKAHAILRAQVPKLGGDRPPSPDIRAIERLVAEGAFAGV
ncbi:MAG: histidine ammonia-lyase [Planctomycetaceae bacterium]|nr:histidine ammonia-lyase [Planctomycetaceae bacterium]